MEISEKAALNAIKDYADIYGYGNCIALLKRAWAELLKNKGGFSEEVALQAADTSAYAKNIYDNIICKEDKELRKSLQNIIREMDPEE